MSDEYLSKAQRQRMFRDLPTLSAAEKPQLTPHECAEQFRMYARSSKDNPDAVHQLNFCADFLDEFCHSGQAVDRQLRAGESLPHLPACKQGKACTCPYGYGENKIVDNLLQSERDSTRNLSIALAAEREKQRQADWDELAKLENQLAAEREKTEAVRHILRRESSLLTTEYAKVIGLERIISATRHAVDLQRQRVKQAEKWLEEKRRESAMFATDASKYHSKLLSALAAIEKHNNQCWPECALIDADLTALHQHDAELTEKVRKPLAEALEEGLHDMAIGDFVAARHRFKAALAQVKEKS